MTRRCLLTGLILLLSHFAVLAQNNKLSAQNFSLKTASRFTENKGQVADQHGRPRPDVKYIYSAPGLKVIFKQNSFSYELYTIEKHPRISEASGQPVHDDLLPDKFKEPEPVTTRTHRVDISLPGAARHPQILAGGRSADYTNYYLAHTPEEGVQDVHGFTQLTYKDIWPKVDLVFYARKEGELKYDIILRPGARLRDVHFAYSGMKGLKLEAGRLKIRTALGEAEESVPLSYLQESKREVDVDMMLKGNVLRFAAEKWDGKQTLVVDPVLEWGTYYGGSGGDESWDITTDLAGNVFIAGNTFSANTIATNNTHQSTLAGVRDAFAVKFSNAGVRQWGCYFGGTGVEFGSGVVVDTSGEILITGVTYSTNGISTSGAFQTSNKGGSDVFIVKFSDSGVRRWGTYYGGGDGDYSRGISIDGYSNVFITGYTYSDDGIATTGAYKTSITGGGYPAPDAFVAKFNSSGNRQWGTYYGGGSYDEGWGISTDDIGNVTITGYTNSSSGIATAGSHQAVLAGNHDAFVVKFSSSGSCLWGTYYGGTANEYAFGIATDDSNNIVIVGRTYSPTGIASSGVHQSSYASAGDAFVVKFSNSGVRRWGTYYGGSGTDYAGDVAIDTIGEVFIIGTTSSPNGITDSGSYQASLQGDNDVFVVHFSNAAAKKWGSYYGGSKEELGLGIAVDTFGSFFITGITSSWNGIATRGAHQTSLGDDRDGFVVKFSNREAVDLTIINFPGLPASVCPGDSQTLRITIKNISTIPDSNIRIKVHIQGPDTLVLSDSLMSRIDSLQTDTLNFSTAIRLTKPGTYSITAFRSPEDYNPYNDTLRRTITVHPRAEVSFSFLDACTNHNISLTNTTSITKGAIASWYWDFGDSTTSTDSIPSKSYSTPGTYTIRLYASSDSGCTDSAIRQVTVHPRANVSFTANNSCTGNDIVIQNTSSVSGDTITSWLWDFGDSTTSTVKVPSKSYAAAGTYTIWLYATTKNGCTDSISKQVTIYPRASISFEAENACSGNEISLENTSTIPGGSAASWLWDFGDGTTSTEKEPSKTYSASGTYTIKLFGTVDNGCTDSTAQQVVIYPRPKTGFKVSNYCQSDTFHFSDTTAISSGSITAWLWKFGDGSTSDIGDPTHVYTSSGIYTVTLVTTSDKGCVDSVSKIITHKKRSDDTAIISGPLSICAPNLNDQKYSVPGKAGSAYTWEAEGGVITSGNGSREVRVNWTRRGIGTLRVKELKDDGCTGAVGQINVQIDSMMLKMELVTTAEQNDKVIELRWSVLNGQFLNRAVKIYREVNNSGSFVYLDSVPASVTRYTDIKVHTDRESYRYRVEVLNLCGDKVRSEPHQSILLSGSGLNDSANRIYWNAYEDWAVDHYKAWQNVNGGTDKPMIPFTTQLQEEVVPDLMSWQECYRVAAVSADNDSIVSFSNRMCMDLEPRLYVPNAFTPGNGDFSNDLFRVAVAHYKSFQLSIYNRWGEVIFRTDDPAKMWDGTFRGTPSPQDVYLYTIQVEGQKRILYRNGTFHLVRL